MFLVRAHNKLLFSLLLNSLSSNLCISRNPLSSLGNGPVVIILRCPQDMYFSSKIGPSSFWTTSSPWARENPLDVIWGDWLGATPLLTIVATGTILFHILTMAVLFFQRSRRNGPHISFSVSQGCLHQRCLGFQTLWLFRVVLTCWSCHGILFLGNEGEVFPATIFLQLWNSWNFPQDSSSLSLLPSSKVTQVRIRLLSWKNSIRSQWVLLS